VSLFKPMLAPIVQAIRQGNGVLSSRNFRRNSGGIDYATHPVATVDRIVMLVYPIAGNSGLPTGAPAVTNNELQLIDFTYSGTISELYRNGSNYFQGIIATVKYYFNGTLIRSYAIDDNSDILANGATVLGAQLVTGSGSGFINLGSTTLGLDKTAPGSETTEWATLQAGTRQILVSRTDSIRQIVQFSLDNLSTALPSVNFNSSDQVSLIDVPAGATNVRIYYKHSSTPNSNISIRQADGYGQIINGLADDYGLFTETGRGLDWLGVELYTGENPLVTVDMGGESVTRYTVSDVDAGKTYRASTSVSDFAGLYDVGFIGSSAGTNIPSDNRVLGDAEIIIEFAVDTTSIAQLFSRNANQCVFNSVSLKETLKVATQ